MKDPRGEKKGYFPLFPEIEGFLEIPEIGLILSELGEEAEKAVGEHEIALEERVGAAGLGVIGVWRAYEDGGNASEEVVDDGGPDGDEEEVESGARIDADVARTLQNGGAVVRDVAAKRVEKHREAVAAVPRVAVHALLRVRKGKRGNACDDGVEEGRKEVFLVVLLDLGDHVENHVAFQNDCELAKE